MRSQTEDYKKLVFEYAVLNARLQIREFFLKFAVKDVYENIGQVLSLVRMQLSSFDPQLLTEKPEDIVQSGNLVGQSIQDLRTMCRSFYPDVDLLKHRGLKESIEFGLMALKLRGKFNVSIEEDIRMHSKLKLVAFKIIIDILMSVNESGSTYKNISLYYTDEDLNFTIQYIGPIMPNNNERNNEHFTTEETIKIVAGEVKVKKTKAEKTTITLKIPLNIFYE